jgi:hypothetical protein
MQPFLTNGEKSLLWIVLKQIILKLRGKPVSCNSNKRFIENARHDATPAPCRVVP